jgi:uncharacterized protein YndB with AHSA1/START domain
VARGLLTGRLVARAECDAPAEAAWRILAAPRRWPEWGPSVRAVRCPHESIRAGSRGEVQLVFGPWLTFVVQRCEPPVYWDWRVAGMPATGHRVLPLGPGRCRVEFELSPLAAPYWFVCRTAAGRVARLAEAAVREP